MGWLFTLLEQHLDRQLSTVVIQATTCWGTPLALVKAQKCGLGVHLPVMVCFHYPTCSHACAQWEKEFCFVYLPVWRFHKIHEQINYTPSGKKKIMNHG